MAVLSIPVLIKGIGTDRFGVLTLAWSIIGYFSLFDIGLGRALTKLVAEKLGEGQEHEIPSLVWTALFLMLILGFIGMLAASLLSPWLVRDALRIPQALQPETLKTFYLLAFSIPVVISTLGLRAILEAHQCFGLINIVRIFMGSFTFLGPLLVLPFTQNLFLIVIVLIMGRFITWVIYLLFCFRIMPVLRQGFALEFTVIGPLLRFGSWMTVSNIISPIMVYMDRFLIGALLSMTAVAYYATPYDLVTKLLLIPGSLMLVLFPAFSSTFVQDRNHTARLFSQGVKYIFLALLPLTLLIVVLSREGLTFWIGPEFARNSAKVLQWLAIGVFLNSLAQVPFALIQGAGRPDLTAKLHLIELPFYLFAVWWLVRAYGIEGAAIAWVLRVAVDASFLFGMTKRFLAIRASTIRHTTIIVGSALLTLFFAALPESIPSKGLFLLLTLPTFTLLAWSLILDPEERAFVIDCFKKAQGYKRM